MDVVACIHARHSALAEVLPVVRENTGATANFVHFIKLRPRLCDANIEKGPRTNSYLKSTSGLVVSRSASYHYYWDLIFAFRNVR